MNQRTIFNSKETNYKPHHELLIEGPPMPGDIEQYQFVLPEECKEPIFCSLRYRHSKFVFTELDVDATAILNQKVLVSLLNSSQMRLDDSPTRKRSLTQDANQLRIIKQSLSRITRYNNKRKYEERIGFASTLISKAEEIGIANTINFLLKVITNYLVILLYN